MKVKYGKVTLFLTNTENKTEKKCNVLLYDDSEHEYMGNA